MRLVTVMKITALAVLLWLMPWASMNGRFRYFLSLDHYSSGGIFLFVVLLCIAAFLVVPFLRGAIVRVPLVALMVGGIALDRLLFSLSGVGFDPDQAVMFWREKGMAGDAVAAYFWPASFAIGWLVPVAILLAWKPAPPATLHPAGAILPVLAFSCCFVIIRTTLGGTSQFPPPTAVPAMLAVAVSSQHYDGPREDMGQVPHAAPAFRNIVMIVDESVRGDYLEINDTSRRSTPFLVGLGHELFNFGPAVAAHNCSAAARVVLRTGLRADELPDLTERSLKGPAIWQFAQRAGFETVYVDTFVSVFGTHSYMTRAEHDFIDREIPVYGDPAYMRDQRIATEILPELLAGDKPLFIYVNKYGAHFRYSADYPPGFAAEDGVEAEDNLDDRAKLVESYRRALRWSVDEFFRDLLPHINLKDTLILYTSDHGQSLLEGGYKLTHCSNGDVHPGEAIVPIFGMGGDSAFVRRMKEAARNGFGHATHFEIFPALLLAMGYDKSWVSARYGASLLDLSDDAKTQRAERRFLTGDVFGKSRAARWVRVD